MIPTFRTRSLKTHASPPSGARQGASFPGRARTTQHPLDSPHPAPTAERRPRGFTLLEIMIVVGIMGIVMTMSVPIVYKIWRKAPMRQAVSDIREVLSHARSRAIMQGVVTEVVFKSDPPTIEVAGAEVGTSGSGLSARLPDTIGVATIKINGVEFREASEARVRFYPNGICDDLTLVLLSQDGVSEGINLEITTSLATVESDPGKLAAAVR